MAFLDDKNQDENAPDASGPQQGQALAPNQAPNVSGSGGGSDVGGGVSTAGVGGVGGGGWTNIQAYLNANQGDNGSAKNLTDTVSKQFGNENTQMQGQSQKALSDAQGYVDQSNVSPDKANSWITGAQDAYTWGAPQNDTYNGYVNQAQTALNGQYGGPSSFSYSFDPTTQNYGNDLSNDQGFKSLMTNLYSQKAGTPLTGGQAALQNQFDSNNQDLAAARQQGNAQYGDLQKSRDALNTDTSSVLQGDQSQYQTNQNNLKDYLGKQSGTYDQNIAKEQQDAINAYQGEYNAGSNRSFAADTTPLFGSGHSNQFVNSDYLNSLGDNSANMTWAQLQHEGDLGTNGGPLAGVYGGRAGANPGWTYNNQQGALDFLHNNFQGNQDALNNFYGSEDQKYAATADPDKRAFNAIQDFLGQTGNQKQQGFKVRE